MLKVLVLKVPKVLVLKLPKVLVLKVPKVLVLKVPTVLVLKAPKVLVLRVLAVRVQKVLVLRDLLTRRAVLNASNVLISLLVKIGFGCHRHRDSLAPGPSALRHQHV